MNQVDFINVMNLELIDLKSRNIIGKVNMAKIKLSVGRIDGVCNLPMKTGDYFYVEDSKLYVPEGKYICIWALQSIMPIFPILMSEIN